VKRQYERARRPTWALYHRRSCAINSTAHFYLPDCWLSASLCPASAISSSHAALRDQVAGRGILNPTVTATNAVGCAEAGTVPDRGLTALTRNEGSGSAHTMECTVMNVEYSHTITATNAVECAEVAKVPDRGLTALTRNEGSGSVHAMKCAVINVEYSRRTSNKMPVPQVWVRVCNRGMTPPQRSRSVPRVILLEAGSH
jgi:hypothetical protein